MTDARALVATVGPAGGTAGGMASVTEAYLELALQDFRYEALASWDPDAPLWSAELWLRSAATILRSGKDHFAALHAHLSERGSFVREGSLVAVARRLGIPTVITLHGAHLLPFSGDHPRLVRSVLSQVDAIVALGPRTAESVRRLVPRARVEIVPNPVEIPRDSPRSVASETVLFAGEVGTRKGADVLVRAWKEVHDQRPDARLVLVGPVADLDIDTDIASEGVSLLGTRSRREVLDLLDDSRVAVLPSRAEMMPMFILEAMVRSRPVIATAVGDVPFLLGGRGRMVPVGDVTALASNLLDLLGDPSTAAREGDALREWAVSRFAPAVVATQLNDLYSSLQPPVRRR